MYSERNEMIGRVVQALRLSEPALTGCRTAPDKAAAAILIGWHVLVKNFLSMDERWKLESSPSDETLLATLEEIYSTNWPNKVICRALRDFYNADAQEWWEVEDVRPTLDLGIRSALESAFASWEERPEDAPGEPGSQNDRFPGG